MSVSIILSMAGGLGLFLYGMRIMSDSIEKVAGARLRGILERLTTNRFMGILVGVFFTALVQSSSACTVMVVSFVNSGLMTLTQAAGVILGANIGVGHEGFPGSFTYVRVFAVAGYGGSSRHLTYRSDSELVGNGQYSGAVSQSGHDGA